MNEKEKNKQKLDWKSELWRFLAALALAILILPMLAGVACIGYLVLSTINDSIQIRQCFDEGEVLEYRGFLEFPLPANAIPITQANLAALSLRPYQPEDRVFPEIEFDTPISHPDHKYFLSSNWSEQGIYPDNTLVLCEADGWASHVLSAWVSGYSFSPDGSLFAAVINQNTIEIYDANRIDLLHTLEFPELNTIGCFAFHPTEPLIAFIATEPYVDIARLYIWNYETQEELAIIDDDGLQQFYFLAFNEEGTLLIARRTERRVATFVWGIPPE